MRMSFMVALCAAVMLVSEGVGAITVRPPEGRIWQTCMNPSEPLTWPWENGADSARISLVDRVTGVAQEASVAKEGDEQYGSYLPPCSPSAQPEAFYEASLVLYSGETEVARYSADIAYVKGVAGISFDVQDSEEREWSLVPKARLSTYDAAWLDGTTNATSATLTVGGGAATVLDGTSGYMVLKSSTPGDFRFDLGFDEVPDVWSAVLSCGIKGMLLIFR